RLRPLWNSNSPPRRAGWLSVRSDHTRIWGDAPLRPADRTAGPLADRRLRSRPATEPARGPGKVAGCDAEAGRAGTRREAVSAGSLIRSGPAWGRAQRRAIIVAAIGAVVFIVLAFTPVAGPHPLAQAATSYLVA